MDSYYDDGGCCIVHPDSANLILTGGRGPLTQTNWSFVISRSRDGGTTWTRINPEPSSAGFCYAMTVASSQTNILYAGGAIAGAPAVYRSTDFGATWTRTAAAPTDTVYSLQVNPVDPARVYAATPSGAFITKNSGATWDNLRGGTGLRVVLQYPGSPDTLVCGGPAGVSISPDQGTTWTPMNTGLEGHAVTALGFADHGGAYLIAGTTGGSCYAWQFETGIAENGNPKSQIPNPKPVVGAMPNPFVSYCRVLGHERDEFLVFDHAGRQVGTARGDRVGVGLTPGVYFLRGAQAQAMLRVVKTR